MGKDGRIVEVDGYGSKRSYKPQYKVEGAKVYETDAYGKRPAAEVPSEVTRQEVIDE